MKFEQYQLLKEHALAACQAEGALAPEARLMNPIVLAYIGDVVFSTYVRLRLLPTSSHVRVLNDLGMRMVSAVYQARAMTVLEAELDAEEQAVFRRGRNAKSSVPKSASVHEYRMATALEALLGYLYLEGRQERLEQLLDAAFAVISKSLAEKK
jgi:ribonuclease-3 family protein